MDGSALFNQSSNLSALRSASLIQMLPPSAAETAVKLQMIERPLRSCWRKASAPGLGPSIASRKTLRGLLQVSIDHMHAKVSSLSVKKLILQLNKQKAQISDSSFTLFSARGRSSSTTRGRDQTNFKRGLPTFYRGGRQPTGSNSLMTVGETIDRRKLLFASFIGLSIDAFQNALVNSMAIATEFTDMPALRGKDYGKTKMRYPDYTETQSGLQYKDLREGNGQKPKMGEIVVVDWDGYTIGYYGRIFEARNKTKGGSFEGEDKDFLKFKLGSQQVIPAFEEAITGMSLGGIRRIIVPPELGYPDNDFNKLGPRPTTFSGQRALDFVLRNQGLIDKTLLFDIELIRIISN